MTNSLLWEREYQLIEMENTFSEDHSFTLPEFGRYYWSSGHSLYNVRLFVNNVFNEILFLIQTGLRNSFTTRRYSLNSQRDFASKVWEIVPSEIKDVNSLVPPPCTCVLIRMYVV